MNDIMARAAKKLKKIGSSVGIILNRVVLEEIFHISPEDDIEIEYRVTTTPPEIVIRKKQKGV